MHLKRRAWELLEAAEEDDRPSRLVDILIVALILLGTTVAILESVPGLLDRYGTAVVVIDTVVVVLFSVEYLLRLWSCTTDPRYAHPIRGRLRYAVTPLAIIDLIAIVPFYLPWFMPRGLLFLRVLRLGRLLRLYKFGRYSDAPALLLRALRRRQAELLSATFVLLLILISTAGLLYLAENPARPDLYSSIPESIWWSLLALTGNGQVAPTTLFGRLVASAIAIIGVGLFAVPAGLLASSFAEELGGAPDVGVGDPDVEKVTERVALAHAAGRTGVWDPKGVSSDYDQAALILTPAGSFRGVEGGAAAIKKLLEEAEGTAWQLDQVHVTGTAAVLRWHGLDERGRPHRMVETLLVRDGLIQLQSIDYAIVAEETTARRPGPRAT